MTNPNPLKVQLNEIGRMRGIYATHYRLSDEEMEALEAAPLEVFFSPTFLEWATQKSQPSRSFRQLEVSGEGAYNALNLIGVKTVGELKNMSFNQVACARGLGPAAMALTLDALQALGIELMDDGSVAEPRKSMKGEALALIRALRT